MCGIVQTPARVVTHSTSKRSGKGPGDQTLVKRRPLLTFFSHCACNPVVVQPALLYRHVQSRSRNDARCLNSLRKHLFSLNKAAKQALPGPSIKCKATKSSPSAHASDTPASVTYPMTTPPLTLAFPNLPPLVTSPRPNKPGAPTLSSRTYAQTHTRRLSRSRSHSYGCTAAVGQDMYRAAVFLTAVRRVHEGPVNDLLVLLRGAVPGGLTGHAAELLVGGGCEGGRGLHASSIKTR